MERTDNDKKIGQEELVISSNSHEIGKVERLLSRIAKKTNLSQEKSENLAIALTELVNNAILHGNKNLPQKKVFISVSYYHNRIRISVKDEGNGFDPDRLKDPRDPENLWKDSGRGIFLVRNLIDEVQFFPSPDGMEIVITEYYDN